MPKNRVVRALDSRRTTRAAVTNVTGGGTTTVTLDHGTLTGLADDDHTQYLNTTRGDARYVPLTRTVTAGNGLTGGGALSANITLNVGAGAGITVNANDVALASSVAGNGLRHTTGQLSIDAGTLITVGTTSVGLSNGTAQYQIPVTGASQTAPNPSFVPAYTALGTFAGAGLDFGSGQFFVGQGAGITVGATTVSLTTPGTLTHNSTSSSTGSHTHAITSSDNVNSSTTSLLKATNGALTLATLTATDVTATDTVAANIVTAPFVTSTNTMGAKVLTTINSSTPLSITTTNSQNLTIEPTGDVILDPTGKDVLPQTGYDINLGMLTKKFLTLHAAELWVETLVAQNTIATIGGRILVGPTTTLVRDLTTGATTIYVKHNQMTSGDRVYMEADGKVEFMAITSAPSPETDGYSYTVTRNLDGTGANLWYAGDAVFNTGQTGDGFIDLYSLRGVKAGTEIGPTIVGNVRTGTTFNDWAPRWAIGNLRGLYGYGANNVYGFAAGNASATWVSADANTGATGGFRVNNGSVTRFQVDASGNLTIRDSTGATRISLDSSGSASFTGTVTAADGAIGGWTLGATSLTSNNVGLYSGATGTARVEVGGSSTNYAGVSSVSAAGDFAFWAGQTHASRSTAPFRVTAGGALTATSGTIGGFTLGATTLTGGNITLESNGTSSNIRVGTGSTSAGIANAPSAGNVAFWAGSSFADRATSAAFQVTNGGVLTATGATISGALTATSGSFTGVVTIGTGGRLESKDGSTVAAYMDKDGISIIEGNTLNFRNGVNGTATYQIKHTSGTINHLALTNGTSYVRAYSDTATNRIEITSATPGTGPALLVDGATEIIGNTTISRGSATTSTTRTLSIQGAQIATATPYASIHFDNYDANSAYTGAVIRAHYGNANDAGQIRVYANNGGTLVESIRFEPTRALVIAQLDSPVVNATTEYERDGIKGGIFVPLGNDARDLQEGAASTGTVWNGTNNIAVGTYVFDINNTNNGSYSTEATAAVILLSGQWSAVNVNSYALVRPRSGVDSDATIQIRAKLADYSEDTQGIVPLDANGQFEVRINNATMNKAICRLVGYYI